MAYLRSPQPGERTGHAWFAINHVGGDVTSLKILLDIEFKSETRHLVSCKNKLLQRFEFWLNAILPDGLLDRLE